METTPMDGRAYLSALSYVISVTPKGEERPDLQHITFIGDRVVGSDGESRHDGYLIGAVDKTISVARASISSLILALSYAYEPGLATIATRPRSACRAQRKRLPAQSSWRQRTSRRRNAVASRARPTSRKSSRRHWRQIRSTSPG